MKIALIEIPGVVIAPPLFLQDRPAPQQVIRVDGTSLRVAEFRETLKRLKLPVQFQQRRAEPRALLGKGGVITDRPFDFDRINRGVHFVQFQQFLQCRDLAVGG